jgi:hypothetical protein
MKTLCFKCLAGGEKVELHSNLGFGRDGRRRLCREK